MLNFQQIYYQWPEYLEGINIQIYILYHSNLLIIYIYTQALTYQPLKYKHLLRLRKEAYEYFKNIQRNIEQTGSIFSPIPTEVRGNIVCVSDPKEWVLGYVDVTSTTIMKRFMPELRDFYETSYDCAKNILTGMALDGYTYYIYSGAPTVPNRYAPFRCVDCTYDGRGTKNKPSWWPTDHL